jgi:hypothetical protein
MHCRLLEITWPRPQDVSVVGVWDAGLQTAQLADAQRGATRTLRLRVRGTARRRVTTPKFVDPRDEIEPPAGVQRRGVVVKRRWRVHTNVVCDKISESCLQSPGREATGHDAPERKRV